MEAPHSPLTRDVLQRQMTPPTCRRQQFVCIFILMVILLVGLARTSWIWKHSPLVVLLAPQVQDCCFDHRFGESPAVCSSMTSWQPWISRVGRRRLFYVGENTLKSSLVRVNFTERIAYLNRGLSEELLAQV